MKEVTIGEIALVYRKVKDFLYKQTSMPRLFKLLEFDKDLVNNLKAIVLQLNNREYDKLISRCNGATIMPVFHEESAEPRRDYQVVSMCTQEKNSNYDDNTAYLRMMSDVPVACEVVLVLWMSRIGYRLDRLIKGNIYGDRIAYSVSGDFDMRNPVLYRSYMRDCDRWQEDASNEIINLLQKRLDLLVFIGELRSSTVFSKISSISPSMLHPKGFDEDVDLTNLISDMLNSWIGSAKVISKNLPAGMSVTGLITNLILNQLDEHIQTELTPRYYSRCGKSILVVVERCDKVKNADELYSAMVGIVNKALIANGSQVLPTVFQRPKTRILELAGNPGIELMKSFELSRDQNLRAWREAPELINVSTLIRQMCSTFANTGEACDLLHLGRSTLSRRMFVKQIQNMESFAENLEPDDWREQRMRFLKMICDLFVDSRSFVIYYSLYSRILAIAFATAKTIDSEEFGYAFRIINRLNKHIDDHINATDNQVSDNNNEIRRNLKKSFGRCVIERFCATRGILDRKTVMKELISHAPDLFSGINLEDLPSYKELQNTDLATVSFIDCAFANHWRGTPISLRKTGVIDKTYAEIVPADVAEMLRQIAKALFAHVDESSGEFPSALFFSTRPMDVTDMYLACGVPVGREDVSKYKMLLSYMNNIDERCNLPFARRRDVSVEFNKLGDKIRIALVSWRVDMKSWTSMACGVTDPLKQDRYSRLMHIANRLISMPDEKRPHYVLFPELAMPPMLFRSLAKKLAYRGMSLISGVDYIHYGKNASKELLVEDQVWCSLCADGIKNKPIILYFSKSIPAQHEELSLYKIAHAVYKTHDNRQKMVIRHGSIEKNICFSVLICSDLMDIAARTYLRGKIDLLFVPAWNQDIATYSAIVESSAVDIHAYIGLSNALAFGDTRLRAPAEKRYARDLVRLRGGVEDYFVVGEIDVQALRRFQSAFRSPAMPFKPTPVGFKIATNRRILPVAE